LIINPTTLTKLENYKWPGNVRELQHAIERAVILCESNILNPSDFFLSDQTAKEEIALNNYNLDEVEKAIVRKILMKHDGNVTKAAKELGITRTSLYRRMEKYGF
jgi:transcriptional regulator with PAS, ATPase and Fis domain